MDTTTGTRLIGVRELRADLARVISHAGSGERILVTVGGHPAAQLGPLTPPAAGPSLWDLSAAGLIDPPRRSGHPANPDPIPVPADAWVSRMLHRGRR